VELMQVKGFLRFKGEVIESISLACSSAKKVTKRCRYMIINLGTASEFVKVSSYAGTRNKDWEATLISEFLFITNHQAKEEMR